MYDWHSLLVLQEKPLFFTDMLYMPDGIQRIHEFLQQRFIVVDESIRFLHFFWEFVVTSKHRVAPDYPFRHIHESSNSPHVRW